MQTDIRSSQTCDFRCFEKPHTKGRLFDEYDDLMSLFKRPVGEPRKLEYLPKRRPYSLLGERHEWVQEYLTIERLSLNRLFARGFAKAWRGWIDIDLKTSAQQEYTPPRPEGFQYEKESFEKMKDELLNKCEGEYVAIYGGKVVDHGKDQIEVLNRVYQKYGYVEVYCHLVTKEPVTYQIATPFET